MGAILSALRKVFFDGPASSVGRGPALVRAAERRSAAKRQRTATRKQRTPSPVHTSPKVRSATKRQRSADKENSVWAEKKRAQAAWAVAQAEAKRTRSVRKAKSPSLLPRYPMKGLEVLPKAAGTAKSRSGSASSYVNHPHLNILGLPIGTVRVRRGKTPVARSAPKTVSANKRHLVIKDGAPTRRKKKEKVEVLREE